MHVKIINIVASLLIGSTLAYVVPRTDACTVNTYRCDPTLTMVEICDVLGDWH
jgi:hypothetical protein